MTDTWTWFDGGWHAGNPGIVGPRTHAFWLGSSVFDGARAFEGVMPDLDLHLARVNRSARALGLEPTMSVEAMHALTIEGAAKFGANAELYIRPMYWAESGGFSAVIADPASTRFCLCLHIAPMPKPVGSAITLSPFRRPTPETAPLEAKAGCLYPNNARALGEAKARGFDNCLLADMLGNVAELATANIFMAKDGVVFTPIANGTFLNGITRQRTIKLLREAGREVVEGALPYTAFLGADEIFSAGNYGKIQPVVRIDDRNLQPGRPSARRASSTGPSPTPDDAERPQARDRRLRLHRRRHRPCPVRLPAADPGDDRRRCADAGGRGLPRRRQLRRLPRRGGHRGARQPRRRLPAHGGVVAHRNGGVVLASAAPLGTEWLALWRGVAGVTGAWIMVLVPPVLLPLVPVALRTRSGGRIFAAPGSGMLLSGLLLSLLPGAGSTGLWIAMGVAACLFALPALLWLPDPAPPAPVADAGRAARRRRGRGSASPSGASPSSTPRWPRPTSPIRCSGSTSWRARRARA